MKRCRIIVVSASILFLLSSCDVDKYFGYSNEAEDLLTYARISGKVVNTYTGEPAGIIHVEAGRYETLTDYAGSFFINYILTTDDERNRPVLFRFTHEKYYPEEKYYVIDPLGMEVKVAIRYAAPVIEKTALFPQQNSSELEGVRFVCQAIIKDYQGIHTVDFVEARFEAEDNGGNIHRESRRMSIVQTVSNREGYFQTEIIIKPNEVLKNGYAVYARDNEGFEELLRRSKNPNQPDDPLF